MLLNKASLDNNSFNRFWLDSKFFNSRTKQQFFFKDVSYQPRAHDKSDNLNPLADNKGCLRDIELFNPFPR
ncbi:hypothetical protein AYI70_g8077, partial [Smittium culicis]